MFFSLLSCDSMKTSQEKFVVQVEAGEFLEKYKECTALTPDTLRDVNPIQIYNKAVQRYASALLCAHSTEKKSDFNFSGISITDPEGKTVNLPISQEQRDSVLMEFIKFARSSDIPYHETVKNFELKMMSLR